MNEANLTGKLLPLLARGFRSCRQKQSVSALGDRSQYVGMSDIARAMECLRAVVADKAAFPENEEPRTVTQELNRELRLRRGHWFEAGIRQILQAMNLPFIHQLEIQTVYQDTPIRAHLDFLIVSQPEKSVHVVEVKSCRNLPQVVYSSYETQIMGQLSLLRALWDKPRFNAYGRARGIKPGNRNFPQLVREMFNIKLPDQADEACIQGSILMLGMNEARVAGPYRPNAIIERTCYNLAQRIWRATRQVKNQQIGLNQLEHAQGFHPLCDWCEHNALCPRFDGIDDSELENELLTLQELKEQKEILNGDIKFRETRLKNTIEHIHPGGAWISAHSQRARVANCQRRDSHYQRLYISPINK